MVSVLLWLIVGILLLIGLLGVFLPFIPGAVVILAAALLYAAVTGFETVTPGILGLLAAITALTYAVDYLAGAVGAERAGASRWGVAGSIAGSILGLLLGNLPGMLIGLFAGAVAAELCLGEKDIPEALRAGWGSLLGFFAGVLVKFVLALAMVAMFLWSALA